MASPLSRNGYPNRRNLDKPWKQPRVIENKDGSVEYHPLDRMRNWVHKEVDENGELVIEERTSLTNGRMGMKSSVKRGVPSIVLKAGTKATPGKGSNKKKKKGPGKENVCHKIGKGENTRAERLENERLVKVRAKVHSSICHGYWSQEKEDVLARLTHELKCRLSPGEFDRLVIRKDKQRERSIAGNKK